MRGTWKAVVATLGLYFAGFASATEQFEEEVSIRPLQDGKVATQFVFRTLLKGASPRQPQTLGGDDIFQHYTLFPLALGQILREYAVTELHLSLNAGKWNYERWGSPKESGVGTGAELWAWMGEGGPTSIDHRWKGLRNALAGLFCASLGSLDELRTTSPARSFAPEGTLPDWGTPHQIRHASLPSEHVCTENLTPFLKLLPCKSLSGVASLLNPHRLFDADWHGMGVHVLWRENQGIEVRLTFQSVSDPLRYTSFGKQDWSLHSLFDRTIDRNCPVARSSRALVTLPDQTGYTINPDSYITAENVVIYDVNIADKPFNIAMNWEDKFQYPSTYSNAPFSVRRTLRGTSQAHAELSVILQNHQSTQLDILYLETMPWLVQFYLHTMKITVNGIPNGRAISDLSYTPAVAHSRPTTFQAVLTLPPKSKLHLSMDVTKAFLRYTEHQPDAQRGWDLPPAVLTPLAPTGNNTLSPAGLGRVYTPILLVDLATPDFSMPYNVIIFSCSLMAFLFGSVFNLLTRKFVVVHIEPAAQN